MKTARKILFVLAIVIVIAAAGIFYLISNIEWIVEAAIEKYGSEATGTDVGVASVQIRLKEGEGSISGLHIGNPSGFSSANAFNLADISIAIETDSITGDLIVIEEVAVDNPRITYEINESGKGNINEIKKHLQRYQKKGTPSATEKFGGGRNLLIRSLAVEEGEIEVVVAALPEKTLSARLPRIHLTNIGGEGGAAPGAIAAQVIGPIANRALQAAANAGFDQYLGRSVEEVKRLRQELQKELGTSLEEKAKGAEESIKDFFGK